MVKKTPYTVQEVRASHHLAEERGLGATASWSWRFAPRTLSLLSGSWQTVTQSPGLSEQLLFGTSRLG